MRKWTHPHLTPFRYHSRANLCHYYPTHVFSFQSCAWTLSMIVSYQILHILNKCFQCYALFLMFLSFLWFLTLHRRSLVDSIKFMGVILSVTGGVIVGVTLLWVSMYMRGICLFSKLFRLVSLMMIRWSFFTIIIVLPF